MVEAELRRLAGAAHTLLHLLLPDPAEVGRIRTDLAAALALPPGQAEFALLTALSSNAVLRGWMLEQRKRQFRGAVRYLTAEVPQRVPLGYEFSVLAWITGTLRARRLSVALRPLDAQSHDTPVTITVSAPDLEPLEYLRRDVRVPADADSAPVEFGFRSIRRGLHPVIVRAFASGTFLGEVSAQISVQDGATVDPGQPQSAGLPSIGAEQGEVTLEVSRTLDDRYSFRLIGAGANELELSQRLAGDPRRVVGELVDELRRFAMNNSSLTTPQARRDRLKNLGVNLWAQAVPAAIRRQFWDLGSSIRAFRILSDADALPWELLYPLDRGHDQGFLVDQFPVVRHVERQGRIRHLPLRSAAYVVPPHSPNNANEEVRRIRELLGALVVDRGEVTRLAELAAILAAPPSVLHFACHNEFTDETGALLKLGEGPFRPSDLAVAIQQQSLSGAAPVVFFNACRTAGEISGLTRPMGWARQFMAAGAGVFIGTLWPVRSRSALAFAEAFYCSFVAERQPLGAAVSVARARVASDDGDPTWLAYTVYGDPTATVREPAGDGHG